MKSEFEKLQAQYNAVVLQNKSLQKELIIKTEILNSVEVYVNALKMFPDIRNSILKILKKKEVRIEGISNMGGLYIFVDDVE